LCFCAKLELRLLGSQTGALIVIHKSVQERHFDMDAGMAGSDVGRNKTIQARSARWRFRRVRVVFAGKASAPRQLLLRCSTSCIHAVVLTPLTYIIHRDVVNADIAGANICPCRKRQFSLLLKPTYSGLLRDVYNDESRSLGARVGLNFRLCSGLSR